MDLTSPAFPLVTKKIGASKSQQDGLKSTTIKNHACTIVNNNNNNNKSRNYNEVASLNHDTQPSSDSSVCTFYQPMISRFKNIDPCHRIQHHESTSNTTDGYLSNTKAKRRVSMITYATCKKSSLHHPKQQKQIKKPQ